MSARVRDGCISAPMLLARRFEKVLDFIRFGLLFCLFVAVLGVVKPRITRPDRPRPFHRRPRPGGATILPDQDHMRHVPKLAALVAILMLAGSAFARAVEIASADDTARFL